MVFHKLDRKYAVTFDVISKILKKKKDAVKKNGCRVPTNKVKVCQD